MNKKNWQPYPYHINKLVYLMLTKLAAVNAAQMILRNHMSQLNFSVSTTDPTVLKIK